MTAGGGLPGIFAPAFTLGIGLIEQPPHGIVSQLGGFLVLHVTIRHQTLKLGDVKFLAHPYLNSPVLKPPTCTPAMPSSMLMIYSTIKTMMTTIRT